MNCQRVELENFDEFSGSIWGRRQCWLMMRRETTSCDAQQLDNTRLSRNCRTSLCCMRFSHNISPSHTKSFFAKAKISSVWKLKRFGTEIVHVVSEKYFQSIFASAQSVDEVHYIKVWCTELRTVQSSNKRGKLLCSREKKIEDFGAEEKVFHEIKRWRQV